MPFLICCICVRLLKSSVGKRHATQPQKEERWAEGWHEANVNVVRKWNYMHNRTSSLISPIACIQQPRFIASKEKKWPFIIRIIDIRTAFSFFFVYFGLFRVAAYIHTLMIYFSGTREGQLDKNEVGLRATP